MQIRERLENALREAREAVMQGQRNGLPSAAILGLRDEAYCAWQTLEEFDRQVVQRHPV
jgi:hypothetical protein